jgi:hypothetical protein
MSHKPKNVHAACAQRPKKRSNQAQRWPFHHPDAFRKYNSTIHFIGFPPSASPIIDKSDNLEALSI